MDVNEVLNEFVLLWAVVDPIGTIPVFLAVSVGLSEQACRKLAIRSVLTASAVLLFFAIAGEALLNAMNLPLASFQIAGGLVLFFFSTSMIFGSSKPEDEISQIGTHEDPAIFPLAIPSIASPGAILAAVLMTDSHRNSVTEQFVSLLLMGLVLLSVAVLMFFASTINRIIGHAGANVASRVMGLLLSAVAVDHVITGIISHVNTLGMNV